MKRKLSVKVRESKERKSKKDFVSERGQGNTLLSYLEQFMGRKKKTSWKEVLRRNEKWKTKERKGERKLHNLK